MGTEVLLLTLVLWLPGAPARAVRHLEHFQVEEDNSCSTSTIGGLLHVDCSYRGLSDLPVNLDLNAQVLDLSNNNFAGFPDRLEQFIHLKELDLSGNYINQPLPPYIQNMELLRKLNLSQNNYEVWIGSAQSNSISVLDLSKNKISIIDAAAITAMPNLSQLDLSENRIYDLPARMFANANYLEVLNLSRNQFSNIPRFQSGSMRSLDLSNCQISELRANSLQGMNSLLALDLSINVIEQIPDDLASDTLQELDVSYNEISSLTDHSFSSLPHLAVLNLRGNSFREVWPTTYFSSNPFLREVHVKGNRWSCEGFGVNLLLSYEFLVTKVTDPGSLICYSPSNVTHLSWKQAYIQTWHSEGNAETYTIIAVMVGITIGILITSLVCRCMVALNQPEPARTGATTNLNGVATQPRAESVEIRVPLREEDLPPSYDEALLMPRLNSSFHSLPDFIDEEPRDGRHQYRRSRSIGDLTESRPRAGDRRSVRRTVEIHITQTNDIV